MSFNQFKILICTAISVKISSSI
uniref:Uncharacterized protein n=1 Tax=Rhizophora mucronata TaxID=61149 RepID=A0A2P2QAI1_RHIMU